MGGELAADLCRFVDAGPSPYHAVAEMARRLEAGGFSRLDERERWSLSAGDSAYVVRDGSSIVAFRVGNQAPSDSGFRAVGAHTDSPVLKVRPRADVRREGFRLVGVEPYGGLLLHTWLDRDLTLAGRLALTGGSEIETVHVRLDGAWLRIPSLAIHLDRDVNREGLKLDPQRHVVPLWGPASAPELLDVVADAAGVPAGRVAGADLVAADTQPSSLGGADDSYVFAPRLDNLASCHAGLHALLRADGCDATQVLVANDHEEVGSGTAEGARGPFLRDVLRRVSAACADDSSETFTRATARSWLVSCDMAHAVHPNYAERHEPGHRPELGAGPVIKHNANQAYATDARSAAWFTTCCREAGVAPQHFVTRADLPCGSTIGPLTATRLGLPTVDVGNPLLSMHSCREQVAAADVEPLVRSLAAHLTLGA